MRKLILTSAGVGFLLFVTTFSSSAATGYPGGSSRGARITIRLYDQVPVEGATLDRAREVTSRIFVAAGIEIDWVDCHGVRQDGNETCARPLGVNEISVRIVRRPPPMLRSENRFLNGLTVRFNPEGGSGLISIFYDRVEEVAQPMLADNLAATIRLCRALVLGYLIAHETGHLLLPNTKHAGHGIMRARLERDDWKLAARGLLIFMRQQSESMRNGVLAR